jgi:diguanylate cyclase (GGDEF)-like protein/PAS domain S-box-containing protein
MGTPDTGPTMNDVASIAEMPEIAFSKSAVATAFVGLDGRIGPVNAAFEKLLGYGRDTGALYLSQLSDREFLSQVLAVPTRGTEGFDQRGIRTQFVRRDGEKIWVRALVCAGDAGAGLPIMMQLLDIGWQKAREMELLLNETRLNFALDAASQGVWDQDTLAGTMYYSPGWRRLRGIPPDEPVDGSAEAFLARLHPDDRERIRETTTQHDRHGTHFRVLEYRERHRDGHYIWILSRGGPVAWNEQGQETRVIGTDTDITEKKAAEEQLDRLSQRLELALDASHIGVWEHNLETHTTVWDDRMYAIYGLPPHRDLGQGWEDRTHPEDRAAAAADFDRAVAGDGHYFSRFRIVMANGEVRHVRSQAQLFTDPDGTRRMVGAEWDVTEDVRLATELHHAKALAENAYQDLIEAQRHVHHAALHDYLTDLPNRRFLDQTLVERRARNVQERPRLAVLHIDLDNFKQINDTLGHAAGDAMLVHVGDVLRANMRDGDFIARVGGDEFIVLCWHTGDEADLASVARRIIDSLQREASYDGKPMQVGASVGIAYETGLGLVNERLLHRADTALYRAKAQGRNRFEFSE